MADFTYKHQVKIIGEYFSAFDLQMAMNRFLNQVAGEVLGIDSKIIMVDGSLQFFGLISYCVRIENTSVAERAAKRMNRLAEENLKEEKNE